MLLTRLVTSIYCGYVTTEAMMRPKRLQAFLDSVFGARVRFVRSEISTTLTRREGVTECTNFTFYIVCVILISGQGVRRGDGTSALRFTRSAREKNNTANVHHRQDRIRAKIRSVHTYHQKKGTATFLGSPTYPLSANEVPDT